LKDNKTFYKENYSVEEIKLETNIKKELALTAGVLIVSAIVFGVPFYIIRQEVAHDFLNFMSTNRATIFTMPMLERIIAIIVLIAAMLVILSVLTLIHELVHGLFYGIFAGNKFKSIRIGFLPKSFTAYCICKEELKMNHSRVGLLAPLFVMGIIPVIVSIFIGNAVLFVVGLFTIIASCGDMMIFIRFSKFSNDTWVYETITENKELLMSVYKPIKLK